MPHATKPSTKKAKEAWTNFERRVMIGLICKGLHNPHDLSHLTTSFNEAHKGGRARTSKPWSPEKVWDLYTTSQ